MKHINQIHPEKVIVGAAGITLLSAMILFAIGRLTHNPTLHRAGFICFLVALGISLLPLTLLLVMIVFERIKHK